MFVHVSKLQPMCEEIGFKDVKVDDTNSLMSYELPEEAEADLLEEEKKIIDKALPDRNKVHVGSSEFKHLQEYDMNKICARVTVIGTKAE